MPTGPTWETRIQEQPAPLGHAAARLEASRCLGCADAPCISACPTGIDIPRFIKGIATGNVKGAARTILEANIFGLACGKVCPTEVLCEGACVYHATASPPISIGRLQTHATEVALDSQWHFFAAGEPSGHRVALVGAGPASLACAHALRRLGHETVVFEARPRGGGLLTDGVAAYKYQSARVDRELAAITAIGIDIRYGVAVGTDLSFEALERDYGAIFLGPGLGADRCLHLPGAELPGVIGALAWLEQFKTLPIAQLGAPPRRAVVIGGGNTAIDATRHLKAWGVDDVYLVYRRNENAMSAYAHEIAEARKAGITLIFHAEPLAFEGYERVAALRLRDTQPGVHSEWTLPCDLVLLAIGQDRLQPHLQRVPHLVWRHGCLVVDPETGQTDHPHYFAGGDCANGGKEVVHAVADGQRAARGIHAYLTRSGASSSTLVERNHVCC